MAYYLCNVNYLPTGYIYSGYPSQHAGLTNENGLQVSQQSSDTQIIQKVDVATMTDPVDIDFNLSEEDIACSSSTLAIRYVTKCKDDRKTISLDYYDETGMKIIFNVKYERINGILYYDCPKCGFKFETLKTLREHLDGHKVRSHICDICGTSLKRKEHLDRHMAIHKKKRPYPCNICRKTFKRNEHLARHVITHSGSKNHNCIKCDKSFYRKDHLKKHLRSHDNHWII